MELTQECQGSEDCKCEFPSQRQNRFSTVGIQFDFDDFDGGKGYNKIRHSRSKQTNVMFTEELAERLEKINPEARVTTLHPGAVHTDIYR